MECAELLDNSAAKHKMSVRPPQQRKRRSESRQRTETAEEDRILLSMDNSSDADVSKKMKTLDDDEGVTAYRRTRSGRIIHHSTVDPRSKRE